MPLTLNTEACEGQDPQLNFSIATSMFVCGVPHLKTQAEADELFIRYRMFVMSDNNLPQEMYLTHDQVSRFVGAYANVSKLTPTQYNKLVAGRVREAAEGIMNRQKKAASDALLP